MSSFHELSKLSVPKTEPALQRRDAQRFRDRFAELTPTEPFGFGLSASPTHDPPALLHYLQILLRRWKLVLFVTGAMLVLAAAASFTMKPKYEAVARISVGRENSNLLGFKDMNRAPADEQDYSIELDAQVNILKSDSVILDDLVRLGLAHPREPEGDVFAQDARVQKLSKSDAQLLSQFQSGLEVWRVAHTPIIAIRFLGPDPVIAAKFVNGLVAAYVDHNFKAKYDATTHVSDFLSRQLQELKTKFEQSQEKLVQYERSKGILGLDEKQSIVMQRLDELNRQLSLAEGERIQKQALYEQTSSEAPELVLETGDSPNIRHLKEQQADLRNQFAQATSQLGSAHPQVVQLSDQLAQVEAALGDEIEKIPKRDHTAYLISRSRENMLRYAVEHQKQEANRMHEDAIHYRILKHDVETNQQVYEGLLQKLKEAGVSASLNSSNFTVVDSARVANAPATPNIPLNLALGLFLGCFTGSVLAFLCDRFDTRIRTPAEAEALVALPSLATIPAIPAESTTSAKAARLSLAGCCENTPAALITSLQPRSDFAECYRALRTLLLASPEPVKVIVVTSPLSQEGKSTTSLNLATVLAQTRKRVLLVDADLGAPTIHLLLHLPCDHGLSTLLEPGFAGNPQAYILHSDFLPEVSVLPAGLISDVSVNMLGSEAMKSLLAVLRMRFDYIVIDTAPVLIASDAIIVAAQSDAVLLTVRSGQTTKDALLRACDLLHIVGAKVAGIVVNAVDLSSRGFGSYYRGYGYQKAKVDEQQTVETSMGM